MAAPTVSITVFKGYRTSWGNKRACLAKITWNNGNYVAATGLPIAQASFGGRQIEAILSGGMSIDKTYRLEAQPTSASPNPVGAVRLIVHSTGLEVANGVALTAGSGVILVITG